MNCHTVIPLLDPYLDSELDARAALEVRQHLDRCPDCTARFHEAELAHTQLCAQLRRGPVSESLWPSIEAQILAANPAPSPLPRTSPHRSRPESAAAEPWWRFWLWPSPRCYAGLACVWLALALLNPRPDSPAPVVARATAPLPADLTFASAQQRHLRAELLDPAPESKPVRRPASPHSRGPARDAQRPV